MIRWPIALLAMVAGCGGGGNHPRPTPPPANVCDAWQIGPIIDGKNYSHNVPLHPALASDGCAFTFPPTDGIHYVTRASGSLAGKTAIILRYRVDMASGAKLVPSSDPSAPSIGPVMYIQRSGDNWSGNGKYETYRWWATFDAPVPITPGEHALTIPLSGRWTAVETSNSASSPQAFRDAMANAGRVGFTFGGGTGYGHGVYAFGGTVRFTILSFEID